MLFSWLMTDDANHFAGPPRRDPDLLDQLIEQYQHRLFRYLLFLTGNPALAEDFFQETWIRVLERGDQYNGKSKFESWLFAIARNLAIDVSRRKKFASLEDFADPETEQPFDRLTSRYFALQLRCRAKISMPCKSRFTRSRPTIAKSCCSVFTKSWTWKKSPKSSRLRFPR